MCRRPDAYGHATATRMCSGDWSCEVGLQVEARGRRHDTRLPVHGLAGGRMARRRVRYRTVPSPATRRSACSERETERCAEREQKGPQEMSAAPVDGRRVRRGPANRHLGSFSRPHSSHRGPVSETRPARMRPSVQGRLRIRKRAGERAASGHGLRRMPRANSRPVPVSGLRSDRAAMRSNGVAAMRSNGVARRERQRLVGHRRRGRRGRSRSRCDARRGSRS